MKDKRVVYVSYEEAQKLIPTFRWFKTRGPHKEERESAGRILQELESARNMDYSPLRGYQMFLKDMDYEFYMTVLDSLE